MKVHLKPLGMVPQIIIEYNEKLVTEMLSLEYIIVASLDHEINKNFIINNYFWTNYNLHIFFAKAFTRLAKFLRNSRPTRNLNLLKLTPSLIPAFKSLPLRLSLRSPPFFRKFATNTNHLLPSYSLPFSMCFYHWTEDGEEGYSMWTTHIYPNLQFDPSLKFFVPSPIFYPAHIQLTGGLKLRWGGG